MDSLAGAIFRSFFYLFLKLIKISLFFYLSYIIEFKEEQVSSQNLQPVQTSSLIQTFVIAITWISFLIRMCSSIPQVKNFNLQLVKF